MKSSASWDRETENVSIVTRAVDSSPDFNEDLIVIRFALATVILMLGSFGFVNSTARAEVLSPQILLQQEAVGIVMLPGGRFAFFNRDQAAGPVILPTPQGEKVRLEPHLDLPIPANAAQRPRHLFLMDEAGELHEVVPKSRGEGRPAVGRFIDLWYRHTLDNRREWEASRMVWEGYTGALMEFTRLKSGRILVPFGKWMPNRPVAPPTGCHVTTAIYSDDLGQTWHKSPTELVTPCYAGYNGNNYGACEPAVVELDDASVYMLMRTQAGVLYESTSVDGAKWSPAQPSRFYVSTGPPGLVRLPDGRIVLLWNNCEMPPRIDGAGVYGGRDALHAAISADDGVTWQGFREIYRDLRRNDSPPKRGDRGTAYPYGAFDQEGNILALSGQGAGRRNFVRFSADWLTQRKQRDDFSNGLDAWHVFKPFGPARGYWRDRTTGARLIAHPSISDKHVLQVRRPEGFEPDGATWNFPSGWKGQLQLKVRWTSGFGGASIGFTDRLFEPTDDNGERFANFRLDVAADGGLADDISLTPDVWHTLTFRWDLSEESCLVDIDGVPALSLPQVYASPNGLSYLRLRSTARETDEVGILVESVDVEISDPLAPPRTVEQNQKLQREYIRLIEPHRNRVTGDGTPAQETGDPKDRRKPAKVG